MRKYYRTYNKVRVDGTTHISLATWIQRNCLRCKRFLSKREHRFCKKCHKENDSKAHKITQQSFRDSYFYYAKETIKGIIGIPMPRHIHNILREYL